MKEYLCTARRYNIIVFFVLWNGALFNNQTTPPRTGAQFNGLITVDFKLLSYINNALIPIVTALKDYPSLGGYDIINEPEGILITGKPGPVPACQDATRLTNTGAGFGSQHPDLFWMHRLQRFVNWQAHAIRQHDPRSLITVGSWSEKTQYDPANTIPPTTEHSTFNYFSDHCLEYAGGNLYPDGVLDFYQMHTYSHNPDPYNYYSPMRWSASFYNLNKPLVIGEFSSVASLMWFGPTGLIQPMPIQSLVLHAYNGGYAGAWSWHAAAVGKDTDTLETQIKGLKRLQCYADVQIQLKDTDLYECPSDDNSIDASQNAAEREQVRCQGGLTSITQMKISNVRESLGNHQILRSTTPSTTTRITNVRVSNIRQLLSSLLEK